MDTVESVQAIDPRRSHSAAKGPGGVRVEWDAEISDACARIECDP